MLVKGSSLVEVVRRRVALPVLMGALLLAPAARAETIDIGSGARVHASVDSIRKLRDRNLIRQRYDYSCGAAALATILSYAYGDAVSERDVLEELFALLSAEEKDRSMETGFSLFDLQQVAQALGYRAQGFRIAAENLSQLAGPVIVYIEPRGYRHFAVLRGVRGDRVFLADPSQGNIRMPAYAFLDSWLQADGKGIIFAVEPETGLPDGPMPLSVGTGGLPQPEIMSVRQLLSVGNPFVQLPGLSR